MKITDVEAIALAVPMEKRIAAPISIPRADEVAGVVFREYRSVLVRIHTDDGISGVGECMTRLSGTALRDIVHYVKPLLTGKDPRDVEYLWDLLWSVMINRGHHKGFYPEAMAGHRYRAVGHLGQVRRRAGLAAARGEDQSEDLVLRVVVAAARHRHPAR